VRVGYTYVTKILHRAFAKALIFTGLAAMLLSYASTHQPGTLSGENLGRPNAVGSLPWYEEHGYTCWTSGKHSLPSNVYTDGQMLGSAGVAAALDQIFNHHDHGMTAPVFCQKD
jgi:hypothetical protein